METKKLLLRSKFQRNCIAGKIKMLAAREAKSIKRLYFGKSG